MLPPKNLPQKGAPGGAWPPESPDQSPIELGWSTLTTALRTATARTREALAQAIVQTLAPLTVADAPSGFQHGGDA